jgi:hypothetical protein
MTHVMIVCRAIRPAAERRRAWPQPPRPDAARRGPAAAARVQPGRIAYGEPAMLPPVRARSTNGRRLVLPPGAYLASAEGTAAGKAARHHRLVRFLVRDRHVHSCGHQFGQRLPPPHSRPAVVFPSLPPKKISAPRRGEDRVRRLSAKSEGNTIAALKEGCAWSRTMKI